MNTITTLNDLFAAMQDGTIDSDWDSLPTFGGPEPRDTTEVWSWDSDRLIVGTCSDDIEIVTRKEWITNA